MGHSYLAYCTSKVFISVRLILRNTLVFFRYLFFYQLVNSLYFLYLLFFFQTKLTFNLRRLSKKGPVFKCGFNKYGGFGIDISLGAAILSLLYVVNYALNCVS